MCCYSVTGPRHAQSRDCSVDLTQLCRYESVFCRSDGDGPSASAWIPGFSDAFCQVLDDMEQDSSNRVLAGVHIQGSGGEGDVCLDDAIPKYVQHQQHPQLLACALRAEADIFYSCTSRDLSFLHGAHEPYHLGESGDYMMTKVCPPLPAYKLSSRNVFAAHASFCHGHCRRRRLDSLLCRAQRRTCHARHRSRDECQCQC